MEIIFWFSVTLVFYAYAGYPLLLLLVSFCRTRPRAVASIVPKVSLIVSVHNGEKLIEDKIANCLELDYPADSLEILIASDGSTDATNDLVRKFNDPRVRLVATYPRRGKEAAQKEAIALAGGEILAFTDVGVHFQRNALPALVSNFADPTVGCVSGVDKVLSDTNRGSVPVESVFVRYETYLKCLESSVGSTIGNSGWFFAVRRPLCKHWPSDMASDFTMLLRTVKQGLRGVVEPRAIGYARATGSTTAEFQRKVRTMVRGMVVLAAHKEMLNPFRYGFVSVQLFTHKLFRWFLPFLLLLILGANVALALDSTFYRVLLFMQAAFYTAGMFLPGPRIAQFFVSSSAAAVVAWWKFLQGERFVVWDPTPRYHGASD